MSDTVRLYGTPPYRAVLVHGGPGGAGEMSPLARRLKARVPTIEAMQTKLHVEDLIEELRAQIEAHAVQPAILVGHSWGAWLALLCAARHPDLVRRLILVSSGVLEDSYALTMRVTRMARLNEIEMVEMATLEALLADPNVKDKGALFGTYGYLFDTTENYDIEREPKDHFETDPAIFNSVWGEAAAMRKSGALLAEIAKVRCPVLAIHGDFDPSPAEGVRAPLARVLKAPFEFVVLKKCGHTPWLECEARDELYELLERELR